jgi:hypothetical protein
LSCEHTCEEKGTGNREQGIRDTEIFENRKNCNPFLGFIGKRYIAESGWLLERRGNIFDVPCATVLSGSEGNKTYDLSF